MIRSPTVLREQAFHRTEVPPVRELAIVRGLAALVMERDAEIERYRIAMRLALGKLKQGGRVPKWEQARDARKILEEAVDAP